MDTLLYDYSIPAISALQGSLAAAAPLMELTSTLFDPKYAFLVYSPLAYLLDARVGRRLIMTTVLAEWLNQILKWLLHGERPYWYVHSSGHFDPRATPIKQFASTCELGPGHPSGHAMVTAAVWYIILSSLQEAHTNYRQQQTVQTANCSGPSLASRTITWSLYAGLLLMVSVSRVFLGCHFPHQCAAGAALGLLLARYVSSRSHIRPAHYVAASLALLASAFATFGLLQALGLEPGWTIRLATAHCAKREFIHLDTAPFFSIMRYCGFALGCGLGLMFPLRRGLKQLVVALPSDCPVEELKEAPAAAAAAAPNADLVEAPRKPLSSRNLSWLFFRLAMALLMARLVDDLGLYVSHSNLSLFYGCAFAAYTLFSYAFINL